MIICLWNWFSPAIKVPYAQTFLWWFPFRREFPFASWFQQLDNNVSPQKVFRDKATWTLRLNLFSSFFPSSLPLSLPPSRSSFLNFLPYLQTSLEKKNQSSYKLSVLIPSGALQNSVVFLEISRDGLGKNSIGSDDLGKEIKYDWIIYFTTEFLRAFN